MGILYTVYFATNLKLLRTRKKIMYERTKGERMCKKVTYFTLFLI